MAENVQISFGIKSDASQAKQEISSVNRLLRELQTVADGVGKGNSIMNYGKQIKAVSSEIAHFNGRNEIGKAIAAMNEQPNIANLTRFSNAIQSEYNRTATEIKQAAKEAGDANKSMSSSFGSLAKSLMRIAKLRLLRGIIRAITQAFREGTENIYRYSQAMGASDSSHFASTMDSLASAFLHLKNSIGAVVAPLLSALAPALQTVINYVATALDYLAQFFAMINGQATYTRAKKQATEWKAVESAAGGAAAAAKEYENTILGFDELNVLNDPSQGGGGGGGGAGAPDYSDMFEEVELPDNIITKLAGAIRDSKVLDYMKESLSATMDLVVNGVIPAFDLLFAEITGDSEKAKESYGELMKIVSRHEIVRNAFSKWMGYLKDLQIAFNNIKIGLLDTWQWLVNLIQDSPLGWVLEKLGVDFDKTNQKIDEQRDALVKHGMVLQAEKAYFQTWSITGNEAMAKVMGSMVLVGNAALDMAGNAESGSKKASTAIGGIKSAADSATNAVKGVGTNAGTSFGSVKTAADNATKAVGGLETKATSTSKVSASFSGITNGLSSVYWWANDAYWKMVNLTDAVNALSRSMVNASLSGLSVSLNVARRERGGYVGGYADGGIIPAYAAGGVNSADLFMANENGNPELVGRIGSRTAVANQGQMVEALAQGLERIFSDGMNGSSNVEVVVNMDSVAVARAADKGTRTLNRRFNVQLA